MADEKITRGERNARWLEAHCIVPEGRLVGKPVVIYERQREWLRLIYDTPTRQVILSIPRKNGKTGLVAMLVLLHIVGPEARQNSTIYSAAQSREQAALVFNYAAKMIRMQPDLREYCTIRDTAKEILCPELGTSYKALSAEASTSYGLSPVLVIHDELGQVRGPSSELYDALETSMGAQDAPMSIAISTQAATDGDLLSILIDDAITGRDAKTKCVLYSAPKDADPWDEETWRAANPLYGTVLNPEEFRDLAGRAQRMPSMQAAFRNLNLNQRIDQTSPLIPQVVWQACAGSPENDTLEHFDVYAGLDLSSTTDLTALVFGAADDAGIWSVGADLWTPRSTIAERSKRDRVPYETWAREGFIHATPGSSISIDMVAQRLIELCETYRVKCIAFDRWRFDVLLSALARLLGIDPSDTLEADVCARVPLVRHGQGFRDMAPAVDALESVLLNGKMRHGGHPVLTMCAANARATVDPAGNRKLDKSRATGRIDGIVAMAMMLGAAFRGDLGKAGAARGPSVYEVRGILEV